MNEGILTITLYKANTFLQLVIDKAKILISELMFSPYSYLASPAEMRHRAFKKPNRGNIGFLVFLVFGERPGFIPSYAYFLCVSFSSKPHSSKYGQTQKLTISLLFQLQYFRITLEFPAREAHTHQF